MVPIKDFFQACLFSNKKQKLNVVAFTTVAETCAQTFNTGHKFRNGLHPFAHFNHIPNCLPNMILVYVWSAGSEK